MSDVTILSATSNYAQLQFALQLLFMAASLVFFLLWYRLRHQNKEALTVKNTIIEATLFFLLFALLRGTFSYLMTEVSRTFALTEISNMAWLIRILKTRLIELPFFLLMILGFSYFLRKKERFAFSLATILSSLFVLFMLIQPLIIRPLFHEAYPIKDPVLRQEIVNLSQQFQLTIDDVLIIDASRYSKQSNAYIYGMFSTIQIVLYDNLVNQFPRSELLAVLSHEMAHQKLHHLHWMVLAACSFFFVGLYLVEKIFIYDRNNQVPLRIPAAHRGDVSRFLLAFFLIWQITNPLALYFSRLGEAETDRYAVEQTGLQQPLIDSLVRLYEGNLSEPNPHALIKFLFYSHPPLEERVQLIKDVKIQTKKDI